MNIRANPIYREIYMCICILHVPVLEDLQNGDAQESLQTMGSLAVHWRAGKMRPDCPGRKRTSGGRGDRRLEQACENTKRHGDADAAAYGGDEL